MDKKYQVFISSTYTDLVEERQKVVEAILNAGHIPAGMELFKAGPTQKDIIREWIVDSDIYVLILGARYGSLSEEEGISYTQWEYNLAKELDKPMFSIVLKDSYIQEMIKSERIKFTDLETSKAEYISFKNEVMSSLVINIEHSAEIRSGISDCIRDIEKRTPEKLEGWIKGSYLKELDDLRKDKQKLTETLMLSQADVIDIQKKLENVKDDFIGSLSFSYVRDELSKAYISPRVIEETIAEALKELNDSDPETDDNYDSLANDFENLKKFRESHISALQALMNIKGTMTIEGWTINFSRTNRLIQEYYLSKWSEFSLIEFKNSNKLGFETYVLSDNGKKFVNMVSMIQNQK